MSNLNFNAETVEPQSDFSPIPAGEYLVMVTSSEIKDTKSGQGQYLQMTLQVLDGAYKNRLVFDRINTQNTNPIAQEIGQRALSALCHAVNVLHISNSFQLHNIPFIARLVVTKSDQYGNSNEVKAYKSAAGKKPAVHTSPATTKPYNAGSYAEKSGPRDTPAPTMPPPAAASQAAKPAWVK